MKGRKRLRQLLEGDELIVLPGAADALAAKLVEQCGFEGVYATGAGFANAGFGVPDVGLVTASELAEHVRRLARAVDIPILVDADTGYGGVLNVWRTVRELEEAGAAAIQLEDQIMAKRCGHFDGHTLVSAEDMCHRLRAAVEARSDADTVIIARTDAYNIEGVDAAVRRAHMYVDAGADVLFIEAPTSRADLMRLPGLFEAPLIANMVEGGKTPLLTAQELRSAGFRIALYANTVLRVAAHAARQALAVLRETGETSQLVDSMLSWDDRQGIVGLPTMQLLEERILGGTGAITSVARAITLGDGA